MKQKKNIFYYLILSIAGAILILMLAFFSSTNINTIGIYDRLFIAGISIPGCIFGISLAFYPGWYRKSMKFENQKVNKENTQKIVRKRKGHHPDCDQFQNHTIRFNNKTFCTGCFGLAIGSIIAILLLSSYVFIDIQQPISILYFFIILGLIIIGLVYVEIMFPKRNTILHVISNVFLMISFLLLTIGIFEITGSKIYGLITVILSFLWLDTRIQLSKWRHTMICHNCVEPCKMYFNLFYY